MAPQLKLYSVPASHPTAAVEAALRLKGIDYKRVDLPNISQRLWVRLAVRGGGTVPAIKWDGQSLIGSLPIMRKLDELAPEPALLPGDAEKRAAVEAAEQWGHDVFQNRVRRVVIQAVRRSGPAAALSLVPEDARLPIPDGMQRFFVRPIMSLSARLNDVDEATIKADLQALPGDLDKIDGWIAEGLLGGETPNAADLQIVSSLRLLERVADVRALMAGRPSHDLIARYFPPHQGDIPGGAYPSDWLPAAA
jgi:glutathione S-transferase